MTNPNQLNKSFHPTLEQIFMLWLLFWQHSGYALYSKALIYSENFLCAEGVEYENNLC